MPFYHRHCLFLFPPPEDRREITGSVSFAIPADIGWCVGKDESNKSPLSAPWLPSTQMMDSSCKGDYGGIRGFVFVQNIIAVTHVSVCECVCGGICTLLKGTDKHQQALWF